MIGARSLMIGLAGALLCGCQGRPAPPALAVAGGDPQRGATVIAQVGCGGCHVIPGIAGARGLVGPPLAGVGSRTTLAGVLPNTPDALVRWLRTPQAIVPGNAMPDMGLTEQQARDAAAYLEKLS
jgi:cytochrome c2